MWIIPPRCGINTSIIYLIMIITTLQYKQSLPNNRASTQPQGLGSPPNSLLRFRETPYTTLLVFPDLYPVYIQPSLLYIRLLSYPARAGIPNYVRRPQHLPLGCQPRSPERSTHDSLSIYRNAGLFRTRQTSLPDSTAQLMRPARQTHFSPNYPPPITRTSSYTRSLSQSYTSKSHNNSLNSDNTRNYINPRNILVNLNIITKRLYLIFKHVYSLQEYTPNFLTPPCHRKRPPPVRRQSPATTTLLCDHGPLSVTCFAYNTQSPTTISEIYT